MVQKAANFIGIVLVILLGGLIVSGWMKTMHAGEARLEGRRTVSIALPDGYGAMERAPAVFDHEIHIPETGDDGCLASGCHSIGADGYMSLKVYTPADGDTAKKIADEYHDNCIGCHEDRGEGPGAKECGECHVVSPRYESLPFYSREMDLRQHQKHVDVMDEDCSACHHVYDENKDELVYVEGEESSCRDCHDGSAGYEDAPAMRTVAHQRCIACHMDYEDKVDETGPIDCEGCHGEPDDRPPVMDMTNVPRLEAGQEDTPLILADDSAGDLNFKAVPFNHINHEKHVKNCRTCHHQLLERCDECHTLEGDEKGGNIKLAEAFHDEDSSHSCVGCHASEMDRQECDVCHGSMVPGPSDDACDTCHTGPLSPDMQNVMLDENMTPVRLVMEPDTLIPEDTLLAGVDDTFGIDEINGELDPVEFPHKEIIHIMNDLIGSNRLANVFHGDRTVVCRACHHHSPADEAPPSCARCHGEPFDPREPDKPGLRAAFHLECIGCHREMQGREGVELPHFRDCSGCHHDEGAALPSDLPPDELKAGIHEKLTD